MYATGAVILDLLELREWIRLHSSLHGLLGLVLGMLLVFRTNTAYDRWWEGRKLWGQLINESRNLAIKIQTGVAAPAEEKLAVGRRLVDFAEALRDHLRTSSNAVPGPNVPVRLAEEIYTQLTRWRAQGVIDTLQLRWLDPHAAALMDICGACERIRRTPLAVSYRIFVRQLIAVYLLTLPWGLVEDFGWWSIPIFMLIDYFMIGVETIASDIEEPFGTDHDDLKLDDYCRTIDRSMEQIFSTSQSVAS